MSAQPILENRRLESMPAISLEQVVLVSQQHPELVLWLLESGKAPRFQSADDMLQSILEALAEVTASSRAAVMLLDVGERTLAIKAAVGLSGEAIENTRTRLGEGFAGWVAQERTALLWPGGPDSTLPPLKIFAEAIAREGITTALYVPLEVEGVVDKDGQKWRRTEIAWEYPQARVEAVTARRHAEQDLRHRHRRQYHEVEQLQVIAMEGAARHGAEQRGDQTGGQCDEQRVARSEQHLLVV